MRDDINDQEYMLVFAKAWAENADCKFVKAVTSSIDVEKGAIAALNTRLNNASNPLAAYAKGAAGEPGYYSSTRTIDMSVYQMQMQMQAHLIRLTAMFEILESMMERILPIRG